MKIRINKYLKSAIKVALTLGALYFVFTKIDAGELWKAYRSANFFWIAGAAVFFILSKLTAAFRLNHFLRATGVGISDSSNLSLYLLGMFYNVFLPGGISGDGYKIYLIRKRFDVTTGRAFGAILTDRVSGVLALFILSIALVYLVALPAWIKYIAWAGIPIGYYIYFRLVARFAAHFKRIISVTNRLSMTVQVCQLISAFMIMVALGIHDQRTAYLFIFLLSSIVAILPVTIGGAGSREIAFLFGARWLNLDVNLSIALSLMFYAITLLVSLAGIIYVFRDPLDKEERSGK